MRTSRHLTPYHPLRRSSCFRFLAIGSLLLLAAVGCGEGPRPRNVVLITLDTLRADHVGAYGAAVETPHLDRLAALGVLFEQATATTPLTAPSHASLFTGLYPARHGVRLNGRGRLGDGSSVLAEDLAAAGLRTAGVVAAYPLKRTFGFDRGFADYDDHFGLDSAGEALARRPGEEVAALAVDWLERHGGTGFFLWAHFFDAHAPYAPPEPFRARYPDRPYAGEVARVDAQVGRVVEALEQLGLLEQTLIVVAGDHGEGLLDHGEQEHGLLLYEESLHVPLILAGPGVPPGRRVTEPVSLVDVRPTILSLLGIASGERDGVDLRAGWEGGGSDERPVFAETLYPEAEMAWSPLRSVRLGSSKAIDAPRPELYDLRADPEEQDDLARSRPEELARLLDLLEWVPLDRPSPGPLDADDLEALSSLGYVAGTPSSPEVNGEELPDPKDRVGDYRLFWKAIHLGFEGDAEDAEQARSILEELVERDPDNPQFRLKLALVSERTGRAAAAERHLRRLLADRPTWAQPATRLADLLREQGRADEAVRLLESFLEARPDAAGLRRGLALAHRAAGDRGAALEVARKIVERRPEDLSAVLLLGHLAGEAGALDTSQEAFLTVLKKDPGNARASLSLARVLEARGRPGEALGRVEAGLAVHPEDRDLVAEACRLARIVNDVERRSIYCGRLRR